MKQAARFGLVGIIATAVHMSVGASMILAGVGPLLSNCLAFLIAFGVSFAGHFRYTFYGQASAPGRAFCRFMAVAVAGFLINQSILAVLVQATALPAELCLLVSTGIAAVSTFVLSKRWAFA